MGIFCKNCNKELGEDERPCLACGCESRAYKMECEPAYFNVKVGSIRMRHKRPGFGKFISESLGGWFPSGDKRLPNGVEKSRMINKETDEYHEIVKKYGTEEVIHEKHEPLSQHTKFKK